MLRSDNKTKYFQPENEFLFKTKEKETTYALSIYRLNPDGSVLFTSVLSYLRQFRSI